jgi:L-ribulose-5-phosphate 4-epimerase
MYDDLREQVFRANQSLPGHNLVICSWGNVSGIDRQAGVIAIKPSGVAYEKLKPADIVVLDLEGNPVEKGLKPSTDTPTHLELYRGFADIGGICHTHSRYATMWAQAYREIPCLGTTHADYFYGPIPVTQDLSEAEVAQDYETNIGKAIVRQFAGADPLQMPAVLVGGHGPFTWGRSAEQAVEAAVVLEQVARMGLGSLMIRPEQEALAKHLMDKHYLRKHGKDAYYGQDKSRR